MKTILFNLTGSQDTKTNLIASAGLSLIALLIASFIFMALTNGIKAF